MLRQGVRNEHVLAVMRRTSGIPVLITAGIAGVGALVTVHPNPMSFARGTPARRFQSAAAW